MAAGSRLRVLAVDDDSVVRRLLSRVLSQAGYDVVESESSGEARKQFSSGAFSLVVTDLNMPGGNGLDLAKDLLGSNPRLPIILLSGSIEDAVRREALTLGIECLDKPLDQSRFLGLVKDLIGG